MTDLQRTADAAVQSPATTALAEAGVSIWLDDLSRTRLDEGSLEKLLTTRTVTGVTTNPSIFAAALKHADAYEAQLRELAAEVTTARPAPDPSAPRSRPARSERVDIDVVDEPPADARGGGEAQG